MSLIVHTIVRDGIVVSADAWTTYKDENGHTRKDYLLFSRQISLIVQNGIAKIIVWCLCQIRTIEKYCLITQKK